jgi:broad specificity phosphatase PhoE
MQAAAQRFRGAFGRLVKRFPEDKIVCVTHGDAVAAFLAHAGFTSSQVPRALIEP